MIEADLQRFYGVPLTGVWTGQLTLRRLRVLLEGLPPDSSTAYALAGVEQGPLAGWKLSDALLGRLVDELAAYRWQWETAHQDKRKHREPPRSVLPTGTAEQAPAPLVSPHALGGFINFEEA